MGDSLKETMARAYEHVRKQQAKMADKNKLRLSSKATRDEVYQGGDQANGIEADEIMLWEPQQRLSLEGTKGKDGQQKVPAKMDSQIDRTTQSYRKDQG